MTLPDLPRAVYEFLAWLSRCDFVVVRDKIPPEFEAPLAVARATDPPLVRIVNLPSLYDDTMVIEGPDLEGGRLEIKVACVGLQMTRAGSAALALFDMREAEGGKQPEKPASQSRGKTAKPATINERMVAMLQADPSLLNLSADKWSKKLKCSATAVKLTETWEKTIMAARAMQKADRAARGR